MDAARYAHGGATVTGDTVDLLDLAADPGLGRPRPRRSSAGSTAWSTSSAAGAAATTFAETDLADWDLLEKLLIRTVQHTSLAFHEALQRSDRGRYVLISAAGASKPTAGNAAYAAAKAAAEAWTLALADSFRKARGRRRARRPRLPSWSSRRWCTTRCAPSAPTRSSRASPTSRTWPRPSPASGSKPAAEVNGNRLWLTPKP